MNTPAFKILPTRYGKPPEKPDASVIIVAYKTGEELYACLDSLLTQTAKNFEVILIDNDKSNLVRLADYDLTFARLDRNYGPSAARNIGASLARGKILLFLDDDGIADKNWVAEACQAFRDPYLLAARGRITPKHRTLRNLLATHYDLGNTVHPAYLDLEGNCAIRASAFHAVRGFSPELFGGEGLDISFRLEQQQRGSIAYLPDMVIAHDFVDSWRHFCSKFYRHGRNESALAISDTRTEAYKQQYAPHYQAQAPLPFITRCFVFGLYLLGKAISQLGKWRSYSRTNSRKTPHA